MDLLWNEIPQFIKKKTNGICSRGAVSKSDSAFPRKETTLNLITLEEFEKPKLRKRPITKY